MTFHKSTRTHIEKRLLSMWKYKIMKYTVIFLRNEWSRSYIPFSQSTSAVSFSTPLVPFAVLGTPAEGYQKVVRYGSLFWYHSRLLTVETEIIAYCTEPYQLSGNEPIKNIFCMTLFYIPNPTQYLNFTTTLLTINNQQIRSLRQKS